jgi:hypothetical protein
VTTTNTPEAISWDVLDRVVKRGGSATRTMLRARVSGTIRDTDGRRWEVVAGKTHLHPEHRIFKSNPELSRHFEVRDVNADMRAANARDTVRRMRHPVTKARRRTKKFSLP